MKSTLLCGMFAVTLLIAVGCGGGSDSMDSPASATGTWAATMTATGGTQLPNGSQFTATLVLQQISPMTWNGTYSTQGGQVGSVEGTLAGHAFNFITVPSGACGGQYNGVGNLNGSSSGMTGTYAGGDCNGSLQATFVAARQ